MTTLQPQAATRKRTPHTSAARRRTTTKQLCKVGPHIDYKNRDDGKAATRKRTPHTSAARVIKGRRQSSYKEKDAPHSSCKS